MKLSNEQSTKSASVFFTDISCILPNEVCFWRSVSFSKLKCPMSSELADF